MRITTWIPIAAACGLIATLPGLKLLGFDAARAEGRANRPDVMSVEDLRPGMKGYGLTVFEGTTPSKFDVEIIDVLKNFQPRQELILVKTNHPRLEVAKVVAGMSGSPVYINGKMIGAYAYGWRFGAEPIAGVTPIRNMLDDLERPLPKFIHGWPLQPGASGNRKQAQADRAAGGHRFAGAPGSYDMMAHRDQVLASVASPSSAALVPVSTPLLLGGLSANSVGLAQDLLSPLGLEPLQAGGGDGTLADAPTRYVDGGAVGVQLVRGDMSAMGLGTVTRVEGDLVSGFGHPMMNAGVTALPAAIGKVLWFLASQERSFKIGFAARPVGALVSDRQASIVVSHGAKAPTIPVRVKITGAAGAPYTDWSFEIAHEKFVSPSFLSVVVGSALETTASERQDVTWYAKSKVRFKGHPELSIDDFGVAVGGTPGARDFVRSNLVQAVGSVLNNPWEPAFVDGVDVQLELRYSRDVFRLRGAEVLNAQVEPGGEARIRVTLIPFAGKTVQRVLRVPIPRQFAGTKKLKIQLRPGYAVEKVKAPAENVRDLVNQFDDPVYPPQSIVASFGEGAGFAHKGQVASDLPAGAADLLSPQTTTSGPSSFTAETHHVEPMPAFLVGQDQVFIEVKPAR